MTTTTTHQADVTADWPLVGRSDELRALRDLLAGDEPRSAVLAGPSGVGKTRLGQECLRIARERGMAAARLTGTRAAAQLPFGAVAPVLPTIAPGVQPADGDPGLLRQAMADLAARADGQRPFLLVDDAHLLDDASATLIHQLAVADAATVLVTVATGEPAPDPVVALWKDGIATRVEVGGLAPDAAEELLAAVLGGPVDPAAVVQLVERTRGNVLLLRELVMGAIADGGLHVDGGVWRLPGDLSPSARLVEIVETRLSRLGEDERALLELVSHGEPLGHAELERLSDPALAEELERRDLLTSCVDGRRLLVHLAHPIHGEVLRARTPALRARSIARSLADAVETARGRRHEDVLRLATWRLRAGEGDPDLLLEGAVIAVRHHDLPLAEDLVRASLAAGAGFEAAFLAARLAGLRGRCDDAERELADLAPAATGDGPRAARVAAARFDLALVRTARDRQGILDAGLATVGDPAWRTHLGGRRLGVILAAQGPRACVDAAGQWLAGVEAAAPAPAGESGDGTGAGAGGCAGLVGACGLARLGHLDAALEAAGPEDPGPEDPGTPGDTPDVPTAWGPWWHAAARCTALQAAGRLEDAARHAAAGHRRALRERDLRAQAVYAALDAGAVGERGRVRTAARRAREAAAVDRQLGRRLLLRRDHIAGALALALGGRTDEAAAELAALDALDLPPVLLDEVDLLQARAWAAAAAGDLPGACHHLEHAADLGEEIGDLVGAAAALHGLGRLGRAAEVRDRLAGVTRRIDGALAPARAAHVDALARGDAAALGRVSRELEAMGADLLAAEASADAAVARRRAAEPREAALAEHRSGVLAERCEDPVTPALQASDARARLTPTERETALLAAAGRSNKEIARELYLSSRTIENRLQRAYEKLGISGRAELVTTLEPQG